jgi:hypothetical protein
MARKYHTLLIREKGKWSPQFGDYSLAVVKQEERDCYTRNAYSTRYFARDRMIITTDSDAASINAAILALNTKKDI